MARLVLGEGNTYPVDSAFTNEQFTIIRFRDDDAKNEIACFLGDKSKNQNIAKGDTVRINRINRVTVGWKKKKVYDKNTGGYVERWKQEVSLNVEVSKVTSGIDEDSSWIDEVEGAALPWDGDLPV